MILIGASGHAKVIIDILEKSDVKVDYLVDANPDIKELVGYRVLNERGYVPLSEAEHIISIGANPIRKKLAEQFEVPYGWAIHPDAILGDDVTVGQGTVIMAGAIVNPSTQIGNHCIINTAASVDHDCEVHDYVHISPNATLCGGITVGEGTQVGAGATIIPGIKIGKWATVGAGAVVIKDVPDYATVVGNPAVVIKTKDGEK
ncbi:acetyltransferase [Roseivirga pacifica]|uniref:acetyltransferase n=1 Tax=Roseivirga pacifica TaxID=1267423 RepID=UPI003BAC4DDB